jgi:hypothetical protein
MDDEITQALHAEVSKLRRENRRLKDQMLRLDGQIELLRGMLDDRIPTPMPYDDSEDDDDEDEG